MTKLFSLDDENIETNLILVAKNFNLGLFQKLTEEFDKLGITNFIVLFEDKSWKVAILNVFSGEGAAYELATTPPNARLLFPDKQRNLKGFAYKVALIDQAPRIQFDRSGSALITRGIEVQIFSEIVKLQKAS